MFLLIDVLLTEAYWYVVYDTGDSNAGDIYIIIIPPTGSYSLVCSRPSFSTVKYYLGVVAWSSSRCSAH